ncbi:MAG TPA: hypothetical protein VEK11_08490 [Thermoanaerobaculia bacterium]|nr:hypothetical protein [Thermoanaerobaculia bacterium]
MKSRIYRFAIGTILALSVTSAPSMNGGIRHPTPVDPGDWPAGCSIPYGYTAACGFYASNTNGECACREGDNIDTTLCMKSNAGGGCGLYENANDPCCTGGSGF